MMDNLMNDDDLVEIFSNNTSPKQKTEQNSPCISTVEKRVMIGKSQVFSKDSTCQGKSEYQEETMLSEPDIDDCNNLLNYNKQIISSLLDLRKQITYALKQCEKKLTVIDSNLERYVTGDTRALICNAGMPYFKDRNHFFAPNNDDEILKEHRKELQLRNLPKVIAWTSKERNDLLVAIQTEVKTVPNKIYNVKLDESTRKPHWELNKNGKIKKKLLAINQENLIVPLNEASLDWFKISSVYLDDLYSPFDCRIMWEVFLHPRNNKLSWTKSEDAELKEITKNYKFQNWDKIAIELDTNRSAYQCFIRYNTIRKFPKTKNCIWLRSEDNRLLKLVKIFKIGDFIPWGEVATWMKGRTKQQVYFRWNYSLAPHLIKGRFSQLEDNLLKDAVSKCGTNFAKISAALMPHRSTIQLHDRYQTLTNSKVENWNVWSLEEDLKLSRLFDRFGPNWSKISSIITCKTRTQLRHRHNSIEKYLNKGRSIYDLHPDHSVNVLDPEKQNEKLDQLLHNCKNDFDKELLKYFHKEIKTEISLDRKPFYGSVTSESNTRSLYDILQELNAELRITDDAINNSLLHSRHKQLLYSLKDYIDMRNNKRRHCMPKINYESPNETKCIDYHEDTKKTFLDEPTMVIDTPDVVISHIGGWEQELEFKKLARLLVQNNSLGNKRFTNSDTNIENSSNRKKLRFAESGKVISTVRLKDSKGNDNALFKRSDDRSSINLSTSQSKDAMINTTSASTAKSSEDQSVPAIETTHATLLSLQRLLRLKSFNEKYNDSPKFLRISNRCQRSFSLLETRLEKLFKYPIGLSKIPLPDVYVIDSSPCNDVRSKKRNSKSTEIKTSYKIKKL
ncbi:proximal sequence element A Pbp95 isoform X2 [Augochlora pura]